MGNWNPRYVAYAKSNGMTPEAQLSSDKERGPSMLGFTLWIGRKWQEWSEANGRRGAHWLHIKSEEDFSAFDAFIGAREG